MSRKFPIIGALAAGLVLETLAVPVQAQPDPRAAVVAGERLAQRNCAQCHAIGRIGESPNRRSPPFRDLFRRYPGRSLDEALKAGLLTKHPAMPQIRLTPGELDDVTAYVNSLREAGQARAGGGAYRRS